VSHPDGTQLDRPEILRILFNPRPDLFSKRDDGRDVSIPVAEGVQVGGRLHVAEKDSPLILLFHGNGEIASDYDGIAPLYNAMGISLLVADYRGYGRSDGTPTSSALLDDAVATYRSVRDILSEQRLDVSRLFIMGRSLGSAAALEIASRVKNEIRGLIIESGFAYSFALIERLGGLLPARMSEEEGGFNNAGKMRQVKVPTLIIHGEDDFIIPIADGKALFDHCKAEDKRFVSIPDAGHNDLLLRGREQYFGAIREFALK